MKACPNCGEQNADKARFCQVCGTKLAVDEEAPVPAEVRKTVSVVFCDLKGSTSLGESVDPETLRRVIARYFNDMKLVLERHGGTVEKFIGDAVMAAFGVPVLHEDDALRAVRAAMEMQTAMASMNVDIELEFGVTLAARIGVNTGEVIAGDPSAGHGFVSGDAINVAARLEAAADPGMVFIGEPTYKLVRDAVKVEPVPALTLKGKAEPMPAFRLLEVIPHVLGSSRRLDSPLVGREEELQQLVQIFEQSIAEKSCRLATIYGNAGTGKSRLMAEFCGGAQEKAKLVRGRCLPYGEGITFWPVAEAVKELCGITEEETPDQAMAKISALMPEGEESRLVTDRIAAAIGITETGGDTQETFWAVRKLLEHVGAEGPLLVVFDDIHWAEPTMLDLIEYVSSFSQGVSMMLLCLARRDLLDTRPSWGTGSTSMLLDPLGPEVIGKLIENLLGQAQMPEIMRRKITEAAEGNPLYVEEILRMLIDDGVLARENGHWRPQGDLADISIPPTISALLTARLDRLNMNEQGVIQRGAVIGREFWWGAVSELSPESLRPHVGGHLQMLVRKELVKPDQSSFAGEDAFKFGHIMIRDAAYQGMPKELRGELHERFATWLERKAGDRFREYEEILGYHLEQSFKLREDLGLVDDRVRDLGMQAAERLASAGGRAFNRGDMPAAANLLGRAVALRPARDPKRMQLAMDLSDALMEIGEIKQAETVLDQTIRVADAIDDKAMGARAKLQRSRLKTYSGDESWKEEALHSGELKQILESLNDDEGLARYYLLQAEAHWDDMNHAGTDEALEQALKYAKAAERKVDEARILSWLASSQFWGPTNVDLAIERCEQILKDSKGQRLVEARCMLRIAGLQAMRGRAEQARLLLATSRAVNTELGMSLSLATSTQEGAMIEIFSGDLPAAEKELRQGYESFEQMGEKGYLATSAAMLSDVLYMQKRFDEAEEFTKISEEAGGDITEWGPTRARVLARRGEVEKGVELARDAVMEASETDDIRLRGDTFLALAEVLYLHDFKEDAALFVEKALVLYEKKGIQFSIKRANNLLRALKPTDQTSQAS